MMKQRIIDPWLIEYEFTKKFYNSYNIFDAEEIDSDLSEELVVLLKHMKYNVAKTDRLKSALGEAISKLENTNDAMNVLKLKKKRRFTINEAPIDLNTFPKHGNKNALEN